MNLGIGRASGAKQPRVAPPYGVTFILSHFPTTSSGYLLGAPPWSMVLTCAPEDPGFVLETAPPLRKPKIVGKVGGVAKKGNILGDHWPPLPQGGAAKGWVTLCYKESHRTSGTQVISLVWRVPGEQAGAHSTDGRLLRGSSNPHWWDTRLTEHRTPQPLHTIF